MMSVIGIDPGLHGGLACLLHDAGATVRVMPLLGHGDLDTADLGAWLQAMRISYPPIHVFLEKAQSMPKQGVASAYNYGRTCGLIEGTVRTLGLPYTMVPPAAWHRAIMAGIPRDGRPKDRALIAAQRLFPLVSLLASARSRKPHDGIIDALLIAEFGRRILAGNIPCAATPQKRSADDDANRDHQRVPADRPAALPLLPSARARRHDARRAVVYLRPWRSERSAEPIPAAGVRGVRRSGGMASERLRSSVANKIEYHRIEDGPVPTSAELQIILRTARAKYRRNAELMELRPFVMWQLARLALQSSEVD